MIFALILAGGSGVRMGKVDKPKQFLTLGDKPIIIHTLEKFYINSSFDKIIVLSSKNWMSHTVDIIEKYLPDTSNICVVEAGSVRNETIMNGIKYIESNFNTGDGDIVVTHDAVRPFVSHRIISENISLALEFGACDTVVPATDTIVSSKDGSFVTSIPDRSIMYQGQTPQSFNISKLKSLYNGLSGEDKSILTDACKIFTFSGERVALVRGDVTNMKITYPYDLRLAESILRED